MTNPSNPDLTVTVVHDFPAAPEQVYDAWLDPQTARQWLFATPGGVMQRVEIDPRVGGGFTIAEQRGDNLAEHTATYLELDRPRRLAFEFAAMRDIPTTRVSVDVEPTAEGARATLTHQIDPAWAAYRDRTREGWTTLLDGLDGVLAADRTIVSRREFDAPRELVVQAFTDPERVVRWWGPNGFTNTLHEFDLNVGSILKYTMHGPDGSDYYNESQVVEFNPPSRIVLDHLRPMHRFLLTQTYADRGGTTLLTWRMRFELAEECDRVREFVIPANEQNFDRLAEVLARMAEESPTKT